MLSGRRIRAVTLYRSLGRTGHGILRVPVARSRSTYASKHFLAVLLSCLHHIVVRQAENRQLSQFLFQLPNPLLQELPLWFLLGQCQSFLIRGPRLSCPAKPAVHIGAGRMRQIVICQFALFQHRVDMRQTGLWTIAHCNCHGTIELYNWRIRSCRNCRSGSCWVRAKAFS